MIKFNETKNGNKTFVKIVNGHKISAYQIKNKFSLRIDDAHVIYVSFEDIESKIKEYCEKLHYVNVEQFIKFEKTNNGRRHMNYRICSDDKLIYMTVYCNEKDKEYYPMVNATDRISGNKTTRQVSSKVYDYNEAVSVVNEKMEEYNTFGYFTRDNMKIKKNTEFVEEKLSDESDEENECYVFNNGIQTEITPEQADKIKIMIENDLI